MKFIVKSIFIACSVTLICYMLLVLSCTIPTKYIEDNAKKSWCVFSQKKDFYIKFGELYATTVDNCSDCGTVSIAYGVDTKRPFYSAFKNLYRTDGSRRKGLLNLIHGEPVNTSYSRYWHGNTMFVRPLLIWFDIEEIRIILGIITLFITLLDLALLWQEGCKKEMISLFVGFLSVYGFMILFCVEYVCVFLITAIISYIILRRKYNSIYSVFVLSGALTIFFDLLTTETLTYTIPMFIYLGLFFHRNKIRKKLEPLKIVILSGISWLIGYCLPFLIKVFLIFRLFKEDRYALISHFYLHVKTDFERDWLGSIKSNINCLITRISAYSFDIIPLKPKLRFAIYVLIVFLILIGIGFVFVKDKIKVLSYFIISLVPLIRMICLDAHSERLSFFTFRALWIVITVMLFFIISYLAVLKKRYLYVRR